MIGIVGGMGPQAGLRLAQRVMDLSGSRSDATQVPVALMPVSPQTPDRTRFLLSQELNNPAGYICEAIRKLDSSGARLIGIACNTAHAPSIFGEVLSVAKKEGWSCRIMSIVDETVKSILERNLKKVGILGTVGTRLAGVYSKPLDAVGIKPMDLESPELQSQLQDVIYNVDWGLKATVRPSDEAIEGLEKCIANLVEEGAEAILLGCSELPLAIGLIDSPLVPVIDPCDLLARALIRERELMLVEEPNDS